MNKEQILEILKECKEEYIKLIKMNFTDSAKEIRKEIEYWENRLFNGKIDYLKQNEN